jgi:hypothetical protein
VLGDIFRRIAVEKTGIINKIRNKCEGCGRTLLITIAKQESLMSNNPRCQIYNCRNRRKLKLRLLGTNVYKCAAIVLDAVYTMVNLSYRMSSEEAEKAWQQ